MHPPWVSYIKRGRPFLKSTAMYSFWLAEAANISNPDACCRRNSKRMPESNWMMNVFFCKWQFGKRLMNFIKSISYIIQNAWKAATINCSRTAILLTRLIYPVTTHQMISIGKLSLFHYTVCVICSHSWWRTPWYVYHVFFPFNHINGWYLCDHHPL